MDTCDSTWHQHVRPNGDVMWFAYLGRMRTQHDIYGYKVANERGSPIWTKIWCLDGKPWTCDACSTTVVSGSIVQHKRA